MVASLRSTCQRKLRANIHSVTELGEVAYDLIKDCLAALPAESLLRIEAQSPQIAAADNLIWRQITLDRFGTRVRDGSDAQAWRDRYHELLREEERHMELSRLRLQSHRQRHQAEKRDNAIQVLDKVPKSRTGVASKPRGLLGKARQVASMAPQRFQRAPAPSTRPSASSSTLVSSPPPETSVRSSHFSVVTTRVQAIPRPIAPSLPPEPGPSGNASHKRKRSEDGATLDQVAPLPSSPPTSPKRPQLMTARSSATAVFLPRRRPLQA